jgi:hypothetical protein
MAKAVFNKKKAFLPSKEDTSEMLHLKRGFVWCWNLNTVESRSEIPGKFEMQCWRRIEKIRCADHVKNVILHRGKEDRNILHTIKTMPFATHD